MGRGRTAAHAVLLYALTLLAAVTVIFAVPRAMPGDPLDAREDPANALYVSNEEARARLQDYYGLDRPLVAQYGSYLRRIATGDLGWSVTSNIRVGSLIGQHLPWTALLVGTSLVVSSALSFVAGVGAAWRRGRPSDHFLVVTTTVTRAVPQYAMATVLLIVFAVVLPWFPLYGAETPFATYSSLLARVIDIARHLALPATALTLGLLSHKFLLVRNETITALGQDYMVLARAKGMSQRRLKFHHAGRNALLPFLTVVGLQAGFAVGGAVFIESVFAYPGMGSLVLRAVETRDYPVLEACFLVLAGGVLLVNLLLEIAYRRLDPQVATE